MSLCHVERDLFQLLNICFIHSIIIYIAASNVTNKCHVNPMAPIPAPWQKIIINVTRSPGDRLMVQLDCIAPILTRHQPQQNIDKYTDFSVSGDGVLNN